MIRRPFVFVYVAGTVLVSVCRPYTPPMLHVRALADTVRLDTIQNTGVALIRVQLSNPSSDTITIGYCEQSLQHFQNNEWKTVQMQACAGPAPFWQVPPRDSLVIPYTVDDSRDMRIILRRGPLLTGRYRLWYQGSYKADGARLTNFHSSPFVLVVASTAAPSSTR
jgi:hypothetical protein